jgi:hypothetical protein
MSLIPAVVAGRSLRRERLTARRGGVGRDVVAIESVVVATWVVERTRDRRFPFRITIEQEGRTILAVRAQSHWPGAGSQIFCLRETELDPAEHLEPFERVPVAHLARLGRKLSVTLDRAQRKRCEFLKVEKPFKDRPGTWEQIFFRTEQGVRAHRTSGRVELVPRGGLDVVVDSAERYPWRFPGARVTRRKLPVGDYALVEDERLVAVVERKTRENFLGNVHEIKGLHQQLAELGSYPHAAVVVEAQYADFGNPAKIGKWPASHLLRVIGELAALHPEPLEEGRRRHRHALGRRAPRSRQHAAEVGAVVAVVEEADVPAPAERVEELSSAPGRSGNSKRQSRSFRTSGRTAAHHVADVELRHLVEGAGQVEVS